MIIRRVGVICEQFLHPTDPNSSDCCGTTVITLLCFYNKHETAKAVKDTHLLNVAIEAEEVEDAGAVHLGRMEATHHGNRAGGMARI